MERGSRLLIGIAGAVSTAGCAAGCAAVARADAGLVVWTTTTLRAPWLDPVMVFVSGQLAAVMLLVCGGLLIASRCQYSWSLALVALALLAIADESAWFVKGLVGRPRPCVSVARTVAGVSCPDQPSFPSGHATNVSAMAAFALVCDRRHWPFWLGAVLLIGASRVYLGVHYPLDVVGGTLLGTALGLAAGRLARAWQVTKPAAMEE